METDNRTYHFDSPRWVLQAAEGRGPRVLAITIAGFTAPLVSTTVSQHPKAGEISAAVGYSLSEMYYYQASAAHTVDIDSYKRLEAYVNYARSAWVVRDAACNTVMGSGVSYKPVGVYFAVRDTEGVAIPGTSVSGFLPDCAGGVCGYPSDPGATSPQTTDASPRAAGPSDAGPGDAGGQ